MPTEGPASLEKLYLGPESRAGDTAIGSSSPRSKQVVILSCGIPPTAAVLGQSSDQGL